MGSQSSSVDSARRLVRDHRCRGRARPSPGTGDSDRGGDHPDPLVPGRDIKGSNDRDPERFDAWLHRLVVNAVTPRPGR